MAIKIILIIVFFGIMVAVGIFCFQRRQSHAATAQGHIACGLNKIAADGADIQLRHPHIRSFVLVDDLLTREEFPHRKPQGIGDGFDHVLSPIWTRPCL